MCRFFVSYSLENGLGRYILNSLPYNKYYEMYFEMATGADPAGIRPIIGAQKVFEM